MLEEEFEKLSKNEKMFRCRVFELIEPQIKELIKVFRKNNEPYYIVNIIPRVIEYIKEKRKEEDYKLYKEQSLNLMKEYFDNITFNLGNDN